MDDDMFEKIERINTEKKRDDIQSLLDEGSQKMVVGEVLPTINESLSDEQSVPPSKKTIQSLLMERLAWFIIGFILGALIGLSDTRAVGEFDVLGNIFKNVITGGLVVGGLSFIFGEKLVKFLMALSRFG